MREVRSAMLTMETERREAMKKKQNEQRLPKFKATTLGPGDLEHAIGGSVVLPPVKTPPTGSTMSVCHVDGTTDSDPPYWT